MSIDGRKIAEGIINRLKSQPTPKKILATVLVGEDSASVSFVKQKEKTAEELGVDFRLYKFSAELKNDDLRREVGKIANLKRVGGVIVQLPLPEHINRHYVLNAIPHEKDIDVLGERALGAFYTGRNPVLPPVVGVVSEIIENLKLKIENLRVAVVGLGFLVGKPIAHWLMGQCAEIYLLDEGGDLSILKKADLVITGVGQAGLIKPGMLKEDATIIDFGYSIGESGKIAGDFNPSSLVVSRHSLVYTPTPGGTGPILVAKLFENFYKLGRM